MNEQFNSDQKRIGFNMAVCMYMVDAMEYFHGVHPDKKDYQVRLIPNKVLTGYHLLAYYYVSWAIAIPDQLDELQLPFKDEYKMAQTIYQKRG